MSEKTEINIEEAIKKASINIFLLIKEIEENENIDSKKIINSLNNIDKNLLKSFKIKLSNKQKEDAFELIKIMKN